jgi:2-dehydro-3-deoxy-D-arabinonate dehydratase
LKLAIVESQGKQLPCVIRDGEAIVFCDADFNWTTIIAGLAQGVKLSEVVTELFKHHKIEKIGAGTDLFHKNSKHKLCKPLSPPEVWACGVTYRRQAIEHDIDLNRRLGRPENLYQKVYHHERVEVFFKGFDRTCVGPNDFLTVRSDSKQTMPEAELVAIMGPEHYPIAYTTGNDMTAWDIECDCPLFLNQAKIWDASCSIGPVLIPTEFLESPYKVNFHCKVFRQDLCVIDTEGSTSGLLRSVPEMVHYLTRDNKVPSGTALFTGTTCVIPHDFALQEGDVVHIQSEVFGLLSNPIQKSKAIMKSTDELRRDRAAE